MRVAKLHKGQVLHRYMISHNLLHDLYMICKQRSHRPAPIVAIGRANMTETTLGIPRGCQALKDMGCHLWTMEVLV